MDHRVEDRLVVAAEAAVVLVVELPQVRDQQHRLHHARRYVGAVDVPPAHPPLAVHDGERVDSGLAGYELARGRDGVRTGEPERREADSVEVGEGQPVARQAALAEARVMADRAAPCRAHRLPVRRREAGQHAVAPAGHLELLLHPCQA